MAQLVSVVSNEVSIFQEIFNFLSSIKNNDEVYICFKKGTEEQNKNMFLKTIHESQTLLISIRLEEEIFERMCIKQDCSFWIKVKDLAKFLNFGNNSDTNLTISVDKNMTSMLFKIANNKNNSFISFEQGIITEPTNDIGNIPKIDSDFTIQINAQIFNSICSNFDKFSDSIDICVMNEEEENLTLVFSCLTKDKRPCVMSYCNEEDGLLLKKKGTVDMVKATFNLEYLLQLKKSVKLIDDYVIGLKENSPYLNVHSKIVNKNSETILGKIFIFLSPQLSNIENYHQKTKNNYNDVQPQVKTT